MDWLKTLVGNSTFLFFFAVVGIPVICMAGMEIVKLLIKHRERMAMIEHGMDPNAHEPKRAPKQSCFGSKSTAEPEPASESIK